MASFGANVLLPRGEYAEAEALLGEVLAVQRRKETPRDPNPIRTLHGLAQVHAVQGKFAQAEALFAEALERERRVMGPDGLETLASMDALALTLSWEGKLAEAEALFTQTVAAHRCVLGAEHPATLDTLADLAQVLVAQGKFAAAEPPAREAASGDEKIRPDAWQRFFAESVLGASLLGQKQTAAARALLLAGQRGLSSRKQLIPAPDRFRLERAREWLAQLPSSSAAVRLRQRSAARTPAPSEELLGPR
jgi:eukaryotic-like serine/threonine-protein kinase